MIPYPLCSTISILLFIHGNILTGTNGQCYGGNRTTFLRSQGYELQSGQRRLVGQLSLMKCSERCSQNQDDNGQYFNCNSFEYDENSRDCVVVDESAQPFGPGQLIPTPGPSRAFFQKICVATTHLCEAPFSFERVPMHVLVGFALEVVRAPSLSDCLRSCLESVQTFRIECKSVIYYHETKECILNREDRRNRPDLFTSDTQGYIVDYFDNNCAGTQCFAPEVKQYVKVADAQLSARKDIQLSNIDFATCQHYCDANQNGRGDLFPCKAFMYREDQKICHLSGEQSMPRGREELSPVSGTNYYEKICLASPQTCGGSSAFEKVSQHVLIGFAKEVVQAPSLTECLDSCLESLVQNGYECSSVMYFYETSECLLNSETRFTKPDLFSRDLKEERVDYFDNLCVRNSGLCPSNYKRIFVRVGHGELPGYDTSGPPQRLTAQECIQRCNKESDFVCRSVDYTSNGCTWSYQDSSLLPISENLITPGYYFEARCVKDASSCGNLFYAFEYKPGYEFNGFVKSTVSGISTADCLSMCLSNVGVEKCLSVNYERLTSTCHLNTENCRTRGTGALVQRTSTDYYENECTKLPLDCAYEAVEWNQQIAPIFQLRSLENTDENMCRKSCEQERAFSCRSFSVSLQARTCHMSDQDRSKPPEAGPLLTPENGQIYYERSKCSRTMMNVDCRYDGTRITVYFPEPVTGSIFVQNLFSSCREDFHSAESAMLHIPFPGSRSTKDCGGQETSPGTYSYTVVVQSNPYHVPGLVTSEDHLFNATCDYSNSYNNITIATNTYVTGDPIVTNVYGDGAISLEHMRMLILRKDSPVHNVLLGEELDLKWQLVGGAKQFGYFIRDCFAERLGGNPPQPAPVTLIKDGCPVTGQRNLITSNIEKLQDGFKAKMVMFRFDGSKSVKLRCSVDMCLNGCSPAQCQINSQWGDSFGRKKRQSWAFNPSINNVAISRRPLEENSVDEFRKTKDARNVEVTKGEISGVFTIVDRLEPLLPDKNNHHIVQWLEDGIATEGVQDTYSADKTSSILFLDGNICIVRPLFFGFFIFVSLLCFAEGTVVFAYCWNRRCVTPTKSTVSRMMVDSDTGYPSSATGTATTRTAYGRSQNRGRAKHRSMRPRQSEKEREKWKRGSSLPPRERRRHHSEMVEEGDSTVDSRRRLTTGKKRTRGKSVPVIVHRENGDISSDEADLTNATRQRGSSSTNSFPPPPPPPKQKPPNKRPPPPPYKKPREEESSSEETLDGIKKAESDEHSSGPSSPQPIQPEQSNSRGYRSREYRERSKMDNLAEEVQRKILL